MVGFEQRAVPDLHRMASPPPRCELCTNKPLFYCPADQAFLCRGCDDRVHSANFIVLRHVRTALCQVCFTETGVAVQGARQALHCFDASSDPCASTGAVPTPSPPQQPFLCSPCSVYLESVHSKRKLGVFMGSLPFPAQFAAPELLAPQLAHVPTSASIGNSCTTSGVVPGPVVEAKRRKGSSGSRIPPNCREEQKDNMELRLATGYESATPSRLGAPARSCPPLAQLVDSRKPKLSMNDATWLRLSVEAEAEVNHEGAMDGKVTSPGTEVTGSSPGSSCCVSCLDVGNSGEVDRCGPSERKGSQRETGDRSQDLALLRCSPLSSACDTPRDHHSRHSSVSSVASCSDGGMRQPDMTVPGLHFTSSRGASKVKAEPQTAGGEPGGFATVPSQAESVLMNVEGGAVPLGRPASSRLRRVLKSWSERLGGINMATQNLAYELFQRSLIKMKRGEVVANVLRVSLAACLWLATKLVELRAQVPGAKEVAEITMVESKDLKNAEFSVLKLLDWQPLKHVSEQVKAKAFLK